MVEDVEQIVLRYKKLRSENPYLNERDALEKAFYKLDFVENPIELYHTIILDFIESIDDEPDLMEDFLTEDIKGRVGRPRKRGLKTGTLGAKLSGAKRTKVAKGLKVKGITPEMSVTPPESVSIEVNQPLTIPPLSPSTPFQIPTIPTISGLQDRQMTSVGSSFVKGVGAYKGHLLLEYHHDPGNIWGYPVGGQKAGAFFNEILMSGSKGGWVWDKLLGKPSIYGMAKGQFFAYEQPQGKWNYYTTPGAQFVHLEGRPVKFTYNPVGYSEGSKEEYDQKAMMEKFYKEQIVEPSESRNPADQELIRQQQEKQKQLMGELQQLFKQRFGLDFSEDVISECVKRGFEKYKDDPEFQEKTQDQKLGFLYGVCKRDFEYLGNLVEDSYDNFESFRDYITDALIDLGYDESKEWNESILEDAEKITTWEGLRDFFADVIVDIANEESEEWRKSVQEDSDNYTTPKEILGFIQDVITDVNIESEEWNNAFRQGLKQLKGRGWHGESERHSKAKKTGKADLVQDLQYQGSEGVWRTTETGKHFFIKKGQSAKEAWESWKGKSTKGKAVEKSKQVEKTPIKKKVPWEEMSPEKKKKWKAKTKAEIKALELQKEVAEKDPEKYSSNKITQKLLEKKKKKLEERSGKKKKETTKEGSKEKPKEQMSREELFKTVPKEELQQARAFLKRYNRLKEGGKTKEGITSAIKEYAGTSTKAQDKEEKKQKYREMVSKIEKISKTATPEQKKELSKMVQTISKRVAQLAHDLIERDLVNDFLDHPVLDFIDGKYTYLTQDSWFGESERHAEAARKGKKKEIQNWGDLRNSLTLEQQHKYEEYKMAYNYLDNLWEENKDKFKKKIYDNISREELPEKYLKEFFIYKNERSLVDIQDAIDLFFEYDPNETIIQNIKRGVYNHTKNIVFDTIDDIRGTLEYLDEFLYEKKKKGDFLTQDVFGKTIDVGRWITKNGSHIFLPEKELVKELQDYNLFHKHDFIDLKDYTIETKGDFTHMYGPISHGRKGGHFDYRDPNDPDTIVRLYKDYNSLKEASKVDYFPVIGTQGKGSHKANMIGFTYGFEPRDDTEEIYAHTVLFDNLEDISDIPKEVPRQVSIGFEDDIVGDIQYVKKIDHLAMSLDNDEMGRCEMGGRSCNMKIKTDMGECPYGIKPVLTGLKQVITITNKKVV